MLVRALPGGRHVVIAFSLDNLASTVTRLEITDAVAGAVAIVLLAGIGLPLVRISLAPLAKIGNTAAAIAAGDLSRRIDHPPAQHRGGPAGRRPQHDAGPDRGRLPGAGRG